MVYIYFYANTAPSQQQTLATRTSYIILKRDEYPDEIEWTLYKITSADKAEPYISQNHKSLNRKQDTLYNDAFCVDKNQVYYFEITDEVGGKIILRQILPKQVHV